MRTDEKQRNQGDPETGGPATDTTRRPGKDWQVGQTPGGQGEMQSGVHGNTEKMIESTNIAHDDVQPPDREAPETEDWDLTKRNPPKPGEN